MRSSVVYASAYNNFFNLVIFAVFIYSCSFLFVDKETLNEKCLYYDEETYSSLSWM